MDSYRENMPADIGFPIELHPRDPDTVWVFPMDGTTVAAADQSIAGDQLRIARREAGASWERQHGGLPIEQAWFTVKRQAFGVDELESVGLYFGTTGGELWMSPDEDESWRPIAAHLPEDLLGGGVHVFVMLVLIPNQLRSYTHGAPVIEAGGATLDELIQGIEREYRGFRYRIIDEQDRARRHIRIFVNRGGGAGAGASAHTLGRGADNRRVDGGMNAQRGRQQRLV